MTSFLHSAEEDQTREYVRRSLLLSSIMIYSSWAVSSYAGEPATAAGAAPEGAGAQSASLNGGEEVLERAIIHRTVEAVEKARAARGALNAATTSNLSYHGGAADGAAGTIGVETMPTIYLVLWGSQWNNNDPSGEQTILTNFLNGVGGSTWLNSVTLVSVARQLRLLILPPMVVYATDLGNQRQLSGGDINTATGK